MSDHDHQEFLKRVREDAIGAVLTSQPQLEEVIDINRLMEMAEYTIGQTPNGDVHWHLSNNILSDQRARAEFMKIRAEGADEKIGDEFRERAVGDFVMDGTDLFDDEERAAMALSRK